MSDAHGAEGYEAPRIEERTALADPLIGTIISGNIDAQP